MSLDGRQRRELIAQSHRLKALASVPAGPVSETTAAHVRTLFTHHNLVKVRIQGEHAADCDETAAELARTVPCELVIRVGRVALLYKPPGGGEDAPAVASPKPTPPDPNLPRKGSRTV